MSRVGIDGGIMSLVGIDGGNMSLVGIDGGIALKSADISLK